MLTYNQEIIRKSIHLSNLIIPLLLYLYNKDKEGVSIKNLGQDLVAMVFNDIVCSGATPLFMNDYLAVGSIKDEYLELVDGINDALRGLEGKPPLISGETAIHKYLDMISGITNFNYYYTFIKHIF